MCTNAQEPLLTNTVPSANTGPGSSIASPGVDTPPTVSTGCVVSKHPDDSAGIARIEWT